MINVHNYLLSFYVVILSFKIMHFQFVYHTKKYLVERSPLKMCNLKFCITCPIRYTL